MTGPHPTPWREETAVWGEMYALAGRIFPIQRSLTGPGVRETLSILAETAPGLATRAVPSGTRAFDWTVPDEWTVREAYIVAPDGRRILDVHEHNLHLLGYSVPVETTLELDELQSHLYSDPELPDAIPYVTSYYKRRWGFCLPHRQRERLEPGRYRVVIDVALEPGALNYGELTLPGGSEGEVLFSTYVCHPSMANNEVSGPVVTAFLARYVASLPERRWTYRFLFLPETIGVITYLSLHADHLRRTVRAGFQVTCVGDDRAYSYLPSRRGDTLADRVALHVLETRVGDFRRYGWCDRGSDERQYCSPGIDLPVASVMRSKYAEYPEYHTSLDDMNLISPRGLGGAYEVLKRCIGVLEENQTPFATTPCEPQLGRHGLYPTLSRKGSAEEARVLLDLLSWSDGELDLLEVAERIGRPFEMVAEAARKLSRAGLLELR